MRTAKAFYTAAIMMVLMTLCDCTPTALLSDLIVKKADGGDATDVTATTETPKSGNVAAPVFGVTSGSYSRDKSVTITCGTAGATIYYTVDGTSASAASTVYSEAIAVEGDGTVMTISAMATKSGMYDSSVAQVTIGIDYSRVSTPQLSLPGGSYTGEQTLVITCDTTGSSIRYTTDGTAPSPTDGTAYGAAITIDTSETIRALAYKTGMADSTVVIASFTLKIEDPTFTPDGGDYLDQQNVILTTVTPGTSIYYTTDGSAPKDSTGTLYTGPVTVDKTMTLKTVAYKTGWTASNVVSATYTLPMFAFTANRYGNSISVLDVSATGALTWKWNVASPAPVAVLIHPVHHRLYVLNYGGATVSAFSISTSGDLTAAGSAATGSQPINLALTPDGKFLYVANFASNTISIFNLEAGGALTAAGTVATGVQPTDIVISPDGKYLWISCPGSTGIWGYEIDSTTGALTKNSNGLVVMHPGVMTITPDGANLYVGRPEDTAMNHYAVNTSTGALSGGTVYDVYSYVTGMAVSPDGTDLYVTDWLGNIVYRFIIGTGGALTSAGSGATGAYPSGVDLTPDGKCLLVSNAISASSGSASGFLVDAAGALTANNTVLVGAYPSKIAVGR